MRRKTIAMIAAFVLGACTSGGEGDPSTPSPASPSAATGSPTTDTSPSPTTSDTLEGSFDVGDHELYLECHGTGSPTVVYFHGYAETTSATDRTQWGTIPDLLTDRYRACTYDRANVGFSGSVEGLRTGSDSVRELHQLLRVAGVTGPYVLLGSSFGGLIAYMYALQHPDDVAGMVLLDPALPGDYRVWELLPKGQDFLPDFNSTAERLDDPATSREAEVLGAESPPIPVTLIATKEFEFFDPAWPRFEEMTDLIRRLQRDLVAQFSPGRLIFLDVPHGMEPFIPERIAREVERVIDAEGP